MTRKLFVSVVWLSAALVGGVWGLIVCPERGPSRPNAVREGAADNGRLRCADGMGAGTCAIFAPGTPEDYIQRFQQRFAPEIAFSLATRWSQTATDANTGGNGTPITLTYCFVPDGTLSVPDGYVAPGVTSIDNTLFASMNAKFGSQAAWQTLFRDIFADWSEMTGVQLVEETADDAAPWVVSPGELGVRADIRIVSIAEDGQYGVLAFNYFPNLGDMALDSAEDWADPDSNYRFLRNVVMHELGHGLGLQHVLPRDGTKLMEAFLSLGYTGPQDDDIRGAGYFYGDVHENNDSAGSAVNLGAFTPGVTFNDMSLHTHNDVDWYSISAAAGTGVVVRVLPAGGAYSVGPDPGTPTPIDTRSMLPMRLDIYDQDGVTLLATDVAGAPGEGVFNSVVAVPAGDTGLLVRVASVGVSDVIQRYQLAFLDAANTPRALTVVSTPDSGVTFTASPADATGRTSVVSPFSLTYSNAQTVTLTAPAGAGDNVFVRWVVDGVPQTPAQRVIAVTMNANRTASAEYVPGLAVNAGADRTIVPGESVQLNAEVANGAAPFTYAWTPQSGLSLSNVANPVASPAETTTYTVAVTDSSGQYGSDAVKVTVASALSINAGPDRAALANQAVSLFVTVEGGEPPYSFNWTPPLSQPNALTQVFTARVSQTTDYVVTVTDAGSRTASDTIRVEVIGHLRVEAGADVAVNPGSSVTLAATVAGGLPPYTFGWRAGNGATESQSQEYTVTPSRTSLYTVTVSDSMGQHAQDSVAVELRETFVVVATASPGIISRGDSSRLLAVASGGEQPYSYAWSPATGLDAAHEAATGANPDETTTYTVVVTDANGRTAQDSVEVQVDDSGQVLSSGGSAGPAGLCGIGAILAIPLALAAVQPLRRG